MSLRIHCDNCDQFMYQTAPGFKWTRPNTWQFNDYDFCSELCLQDFVRREVLHEPTVIDAGAVREDAAADKVRAL